MEAFRLVKSIVCPRCLGDLKDFYTEEGGIIVPTDGKVVCPHCGFTIEGPINECSGEDVDNEG